MKRKIALLMSIVTVTTVLAGALCGCDKTVKYKTGDVYVNRTGSYGFTSAQKIAEFGEGVKPYGGKSSKANYANAYLSDVKLLMVQKTEGDTNLYGLYSLTGEVVLPVEYTEISTSYGFVSARHSDGTIVCLRPSGETVLKAVPESSGYKISDKNGNQVVLSLNFDKTNAINLLIRPVSDKYIAVRSNIGKLLLFDAEASEAVKTEYSGNMSEFKTVDDYLVQNFTENSLPAVCIYRIGDKSPVSGGRIVGSDEDEVVNVTYLGNGNFYCAKMLKLSSTTVSTEGSADTEGETAEEDYDYVDLSGNKCKIDIFMFDAKTGKSKTLSDEVIYSSIVNRYYEVESSLEVSKYLKDGFSYVSVGLIKTDEKNTQFEAFIIDSEGNAVASMTSEYGYINPSSDGAAYRDMLIEYVDGIGLGVTNEKGPLAVYDRNGKLILFKSDADYSKAQLNGNVVTALRTDSNGNSYYVAYGLDGSEIVSAEQCFTALTKFTGGYAIGVSKGMSSSTQCSIIGSDGRVYPSNTYASKSTYYYCAGAQVVKNSDGKYGLLSVSSEPVELVGFVADNIVLANYEPNTVIYYTVIDGIYTAYFLK